MIHIGLICNLLGNATTFIACALAAMGTLHFRILFDIDEVTEFEKAYCALPFNLAHLMLFNSLHHADFNPSRHLHLLHS